MIFISSLFFIFLFIFLYFNTISPISKPIIIKFKYIKNILLLNYINIILIN